LEIGSELADKALLTLVTAVSAGIFLMSIAQRIGIPAIVLLLAGGILLGPEVVGIIDPKSLGHLLSPLVSLAVGLILFEAGMTLDISGYKSASKVIQRLLTLGTLITWLGTALAIWLIKGTEPRMAILAASLVIVTGPTVILPLLKRIRVIPKVHHILQWEGVLIDPIGVFVAVLCFEWLTSSSQLGAATDFAIRIIAGVGIGLFGGIITYFILKKRLAPEHMVGVATLGCAAFTFGVSEMIIAESGLLSTIVAGFVTALFRPVDIKRVLEFKAEVADLLIAVLFMVLAARLEVQQFLEFGWRGWLVVAAVMVVVRPLNILACTAGQGMPWREKAFLSWLAPRGIVAASMASLFRIMLEEDNSFIDPTFVETFTYSVIFATIIIEGLLANRVAIILGLKRPDATGWLIVGAHEFSRRLARYFAKSGLPVVIVDSNPRAVKAIGADPGVTTMQRDARDVTLFENEQLMSMGNVLALTDNEDLNLVICARLRQSVGREHVHAWVSQGSGHGMETEAARLVWQKLPKPSMVSYELTQHETRMFSLSGNMSAPVESAILATIGEGKVEILPENPVEQVSADLSQIVLVRSSNHLQRSLAPELCFDVSETQLEPALTVTFEGLLTQYPKLPAETLVREIVSREREFSTVLGYGIAVPHVYTRHIANRICCIVRCIPGLEFGTEEASELVKLMFLIISPSGDPEGHLAVMAEIAHLINDPEMKNRILEADSCIEVYNVINKGY